MKIFDCVGQLAVISYRVCASLRPSESPCGECSDEYQDVQQELALARPLLPANETRLIGRVGGYLPLWRVCWRSAHCVAGGARGQFGLLFVRDCTGLVRKKPRFGVRVLAGDCIFTAEPFHTAAIDRAVPGPPAPYGILPSPVFQAPARFVG